LVVVSLLSLFGATNGRVVVQSLALVVLFFLFALVVANVVKEKRDVTLILYALLLSAFLASLYGLLQYLGVMRGPSGGRSGLGEVISTMGNYNYLGGFLAYLSFPSIILIVRLRSRLLRALAIGLLSFNFGMIMLIRQTGTRIGLIAGLMGLLIAWAIFRPIEPIRRNRVWLLALLFILVFTFLVEAPSGPLNSVVGLSADGSWLGRLWQSNVDKARTWDWWVGWEMFKDHPIVGVGLGNYKLDFIPYKAKFLATPQGAGYDFYIPRAAQAHNEYVQVLAELGSLGILATLALLVMIPITFWRRLRSNLDEGDRFDLILFGCGVVVFLVHAVVSFPAHLPASSLVLVLVLGLACSQAYGKTASVSVCLKGWPHKVVVAILTAFCLVVSVSAARDYSADRLFNRGALQLQMGQLQLAEATLEESARRDFCPRHVYFHLATAKYGQGRVEEAMTDLERCLTRFVAEETYLNLASLALDLGDVETAREHVDLLLAAILHANLRWRAEYVSGVIAIREGDYDRALAELEPLVERYPESESFYIALGELYRARGMPMTARKYYHRALEIIGPRLFQAQDRFTSAATPVEEYASLRNTIQILSKELEVVKAALAQLPPCYLDGIRDVSVEDCVRLIADVVLESPAALTDNQLIEIARQTVGEIISSRAVNAITVAFWRPETIVDKKSPAASVDWAPGGEWDRADTVSPGDYSRHAYRVNANDTATW